MSSRTWARHYQDDWSARSGDPRLPAWLRIACLAFGSHANNGHARYKRGEVALVLASVDHETGEVRPFANIGREIARAVEYGWLEDGSYWGCLIVPAHAIRKGDLAEAIGRCPLVRRHAAHAKPSLSEGKRPTSSTPSEGFEVRSPHSVSDSTLRPLSSLLQSVRQDGSTTTDRKAS